MTELLNSNFQPLKTSFKKFSDVFFDLLVNRSSSTRIASGYISEESIADLINLYETGYNKTLDLIIGMHYFEGFSYGQYYALMRLNEILSSKNLGGIYISTLMKYHGKVYSFCENGKYISIIGSSNLTKISITKENSAERVYDTDLYINDEPAAADINNFIIDLQNKFCTNLNNIQFEKIKIIEPDNLFKDYLSVEKVSLDNIKDKLTDISFVIPLKTEKKSNLNVYFGKGRQNFSNGSILPRDWYEVEIIVPSKTTEKNNYPKNQQFYVITDDGYKFEYKTSGDYSKNFRSASDLKILGRWIKGRMENRRVLKICEKVTEEVLTNYGSHVIHLTKMKIPNTWYLDFGGNK
ncbi:MAG: NgoFVII family restriction endonuclease [Treponema sp.]|nr:NgoFVII family restriction endonuclease [Treponema sp.]